MSAGAEGAGSAQKEDRDSPPSVPGEGEATGPFQDPQAEANLRRTLRRGNINFDFLNPTQLAAGAQAERTIERRSGERKDKRGLFNRGRPPRAVTARAMVLWGLLCVACTTGLVSVFAFAESLFWLMGVPFLAAGFFWSLIMLALFAARPR